MENLINIKVRVIGQEGLIKEFTLTIPENDLNFEFTECSKIWGEYCVNFSWEGGFIFGMPYEQKRDEELLNEGSMSWEKYCEKWFSQVPSFSLN